MSQSQDDSETQANGRGSIDGLQRLAMNMKLQGRTSYPRVDVDMCEEIQADYADPDMSPSEIERKYDVSERTVRLHGKDECKHTKEDRVKKP